ncbi:hypothetical protein FG386_001413 [Cryptosporidium ryanae]|uniref:uncharacterized protein n=1 Tax=Cryptosporidium ryanae TaxID=515981 RepID=UPI003519F06D|nr:hypothetical protein FG386_001413 [Cryptosporidium ryanae]
MLDSVIGCILLDSDGNRIAARYYGNLNKSGFTDYPSQRLFEEQLHNKGSRISCKGEAEAFFVSDFTCLVRPIGDTFIYLVFYPSENELILNNTINCVYDSLENVVSGHVSKKTLFESLDSVHLILDEVVDSSGVLFETDFSAVCQRAKMQGSEGLEHTAFNQAFATAKENIMRGFL